MAGPVGEREARKEGGTAGWFISRNLDRTFSGRRRFRGADAQSSHRSLYFAFSFSFFIAFFLRLRRPSHHRTPTYPLSCFAGKGRIPLEDGPGLDTAVCSLI